MAPKSGPLETCSSANLGMAENSGIVLQWEDFTFWGEQTQLVCDNNHAFRLYPNVSLKGKSILQPERLVNGESSLQGIFYCVAVPVCGDQLEENANNFKCIVFNIKDEVVQFVPFLYLNSELQVDETACSIDWEKAQNSARSFFLKPLYIEYQTPSEIGEECVIAKVVPPEQQADLTNIPQKKQAAEKGRGVWARRGKTCQINDQLATETSTKRPRLAPKRFNEMAQIDNPSKKLQQASEKKTQPTLTQAGKSLPRTPRSKATTNRPAEKKQTQPAKIAPMKKATESHPVPSNLDSNLQNLSKLDKILSLVEKLDARVSALESSNATVPAPNQTPHSSQVLPRPSEAGLIIPSGAVVGGQHQIMQSSVEGDSPMTRAMQSYLSYLSMKKLFR